MAHDEKGGAEQGEFPVHVDLLPGMLTAKVYLHSVDSPDGPVACWTYVSDGFLRQQQKEVVFTLQRQKDQQPGDFPQDPFLFFRSIYPLAQQGQRVDAGDVTELAAPHFLGRRVVAYVPPQPLADVAIPAPALAAVLLTDEELTAVKAFGLTRVMARLGKAYSHYPWPTWSDPCRPSRSFRTALQQSILVRTKRLRVPGASVCQAGNRIRLSLLRKSAEILRSGLDQLDANAPLALLTELDPQADGCLVWEPGQSQPEAIAPPGSAGSRVSGCFLVFVPGQTEEGGQVFEDGFVVTLTDASWKKIGEAWAAGEDLFLTATAGGIDFSLEWIEEVFHNPVDGLAYQSEGGWRKYIPKKPREDTMESPVRLKEFILLTSEEEMASRIGVTELSDYMRAIEDTVRKHFGAASQSPGQDFAVQIEAWPDGKVELRMASNPGIPDETVEELHHQLVRLPIPPLTGGEIKFQVQFAIWGGKV